VWPLWRLKVDVRHISDTKELADREPLEAERVFVDRFTSAFARTAPLDGEFVLFKAPIPAIADFLKGADRNSIGGVPMPFPEVILPQRRAYHGNILREIVDAIADREAPIRHKLQILAAASDACAWLPEPVKGAQAEAMMRRRLSVSSSVSLDSS
jgi:hypothetical protein